MFTKTFQKRHLFGLWRDMSVRNDLCLFQTNQTRNQYVTLSECVKHVLLIIIQAYSGVPTHRNVAMH